MAEPMTQAQLSNWGKETYDSWVRENFATKKETKTVKIDTANGVARKVLDIVTAARLEGITGNDIRAQFAANSNPSSTMTRLRRAGHILHANRNVGKGGRRVEVFWVPGFAPEDAHARDFVNSAQPSLRKAEKAVKTPPETVMTVFPLPEGPPPAEGLPVRLHTQDEDKGEVQSVDWPRSSPFADICGAVSPVNTGYQFRVAPAPTDPYQLPALAIRIAALEDKVAHLTAAVADLESGKDKVAEPDVDPLLVEAREIACSRAMHIARGNVADDKAWDRALRVVEEIRAGKHDTSAAVDSAYRALKSAHGKE